MIPTEQQKQTLQQIAAAEILGWTKKFYPSRDEQTFVGLEAMPERTEWTSPDESVIALEPPDFHTDANASLQLIEWMKEKGFACYTQSDILGKHHCHFTNGENGYESKDEDSFPLAILHAFLRANGREDLL